MWVTFSHFFGFSDFEICTWPIFTNSVSTEAGKLGLTRRTCFVARGLEVVAGAALLWLRWCAFQCGGVSWWKGGGSFFIRAPTAYCKLVAALPHLPAYGCCSTVPGRK